MAGKGGGRFLMRGEMCDCCCHAMKLILSWPRSTSIVLGCDVFSQIGFKKTSSLRQFLVKADNMSTLETSPSSTKGHDRCGGCSICYLAVRTKVIIFPQLGFEHKLKKITNCKTRFCVYLLTCKYVGFTIRHLKVHIQEHLSRRKHNIPEAPLVKHFSDLGHQYND